MSSVRFTELSHAECVAVLQRNAVGRVALVAHERIEIVPIHFVHDDGWIFGRTSAGRKLDSIQTRWWVAFEVDEVDALFDWRSVIVHGGFYIFDPAAGVRDARLYKRALAAMRRLVPETLRSDDPVPERELFFGIALQEVTGRAASSGTAGR